MMTNSFEGTMNLDELNNMYDVPEDYTLGEYDEAREAEAAEIMEEVFPQEIVENWDDLSPEAHEQLLDEFSARLGESLGIGPVDTVVEPMDPSTFGYTDGNGTIHLNAEYVDTPGHLAAVLNTSAHETRHLFQQEVAAHPEDFPDLPEGLAEAWADNYVNYISAEYDPEGYAYQPIEVDARAYAEGVIDRYLYDMMP